MRKGLIRSRRHLTHGGGSGGGGGDRGDDLRMRDPMHSSSHVGPMPARSARRDAREREFDRKARTSLDDHAEEEEPEGKTPRGIEPLQPRTLSEAGTPVRAWECWFASLPRCRERTAWSKLVIVPSAQANRSPRRSACHHIAQLSLEEPRRSRLALRRSEPAAGANSRALAAHAVKSAGAFDRHVEPPCHGLNACSSRGLRSGSAKR